MGSTSTLGHKYLTRLLSDPCHNEPAGTLIGPMSQPRVATFSVPADFLFLKFFFLEFCMFNCIFIFATLAHPECPNIGTSSPRAGQVGIPQYSLARRSKGIARSAL